ncbi:MAG TPA: UDP-N-acetylglucosamine 2-epimerase (non-hydrolyzing) [Cryomorphaceae bacterium]|nr:UDP-N-acetylglucosamine 2-epimerase (non-hydrolyzing) [Owenweeksia sp.]MBF99315.1 UDP-N-acetylglucosamine 2-epimerase (non-hydrolyzing) [Owenweeksia sp.]HAD96668.1 UDP-N-acetylglucosamine 2-epimerase (non-hydrolyzing) [Cryomorphaceae bacterium]HBF19256.1 UDP-N-acetylglucosamine 2-epimerase (non-hydrolyzing) [Cryomorphaceae bacterium]HCQ16589.1 UDP-N-acetylglucosamine 2-epimerase (non-hydrolyzing) [Cryomorphaceae bacterium]
MTLSQHMKKIAVIVGTRPNFIKITQLKKELERYPGKFQQVLIHTGQHFDEKMSSVFFEQFQLKPDYHLGVMEKDRAAKNRKMTEEIRDVLEQEKPALVVVVGDVDSSYAAADAAKQLHLPLAHIESGLRSFDQSMPEEVNRIGIDDKADLFFVTEESGMKNLKDEGVEDAKVHFVGNTMIDTLVHFEGAIRVNTILQDLGLSPQDYILMTMHRPANVDQKKNLQRVLQLIVKIADYRKVVLPVHPRTLKQISEFGLKKVIEGNSKLVLLEPLDYFAFQNLIMNSLMVITDSGGIQEETTFRKIPCLTLRDNTERPSTLEIGSNELVPLDESLILSKVEAICNGNTKECAIPPLWDGKATARIVDVLNKVL